jgi:hypothetical protein
MKTTPSPLLATALFLSAALPSGYAAGRKVDSVQPKINLVSSPEIMAQLKYATPTQPKRPRPVMPGEPAPLWLEFEVEFETAEEFPELTVKYGLLLKVGQNVKLVEGEVTHVDVGKGKERHSVVYIAPKTLNKLGEGKPFTVANVRAFWVEMYSGNEAVGAQFKANQGATVTYDAIAKEKDKLDKVGDAFLNKTQTPFAPLFYDYYEAVKPSGR